MAVEEVKAEVDETANEITDLDKKIIRQIEYYFGDVNYPRDKFLREKITEDEGWITIECLTTFNRLKMLSTDFAVIASALKKSKSGLLEVNDTDFKVRRSPNKPVPDSSDPMVRKASKLKTLYMKGFSETYTMDDVQEFFIKQDVTTVFVKLKTDEKRNFKGSIFVELTTQQEADKLLNAKDLKCEENVLTVMTRDDHYKEKNEEKKNNPPQNDDKKEEDKKFMRKLGCVLHFDGVGENTSREDLRELFGSHAPVAWVDFSRGDSKGFIRFNEEGAAKKVIETIKAENDGKVLIKEEESEVHVLEGEEEENYWATVEEDMKRRSQGRKGGKKERHFKRKRPWEKNKKEKVKTEDKEDVKNDHKRFDSDDEGNADKIESSKDSNNTHNEKKSESEEKSEAKPAEENEGAPEVKKAKTED